MLLSYNSFSLPFPPKFLPKLSPPSQSQELQCENTTQRRLLVLQIPPPVTQEKAVQQLGALQRQVCVQPEAAAAQGRDGHTTLYCADEARIVTHKHILCPPSLHPHHRNSLSASGAPLLHSQMLNVSSQHTNKTLPVTGRTARKFSGVGHPLYKAMQEQLVHHNLQLDLRQSIYTHFY